MSRRILLADDSVTIQKVIELTFMDEDFEVRAVSNGDEAVALLGDMKPDVVIADVHMPGANGYEVCRRSKGLFPNIPVLLLVGTFEPFDEAQARSCGSDSYLKKPFDSQELLQRVQDLLAAQAPAPAAASPFAAMEEPAFATDFAPEPAWGNLELEAEPLALPSLPESPFQQAGDVFALEEDRSPFAVEEERSYAVEDDRAFSLEDDTSLSLEEPITFRDEAGEAPSFAAQDRFLEDIEPAIPVTPAAPETPAIAPLWATPEPAAAGFEPWGGMTEEERIGVPFGAAPLLGSLEETEERIEAAPSRFAELDSVPGIAEHEPAAPAVSFMPPPAAPAPVEGHAAAPSGNGSASLSDQDIERVARRVVELIGEKIVRDIAWEVIPDLAEVVIKDRLRELESQVE